MIETLKTLCALNGVSGDEDAVRDYLRTQAEPYADAIRTDALGNLIVFKRGRRATGSKLLLCAHMDEVGLIVTRATEDGFLKFDFVGGVDRRVVLGKPVELGPDRVPGIVGMKAIHMLTAEERKKVPKTESLYLDIGASDKEEALSKVPLGTYGAFVGEPEELGDGFLKSKAIDDRVGCAILLELLKEDLPLDVTFAFTAQEEVGTRGAFGAAFSVTPEIALVLETTTAADLPEIEGARRVCAPGKGPVISYMDGGTIYDRELFETLRRLAEEGSIPWQTKEYIAGGNDARTIQRSKAGVRVAALIAGTSLLTYTTSPIVLTDAIEALLKPLNKLHFPVHELAMMMSIALRFIPTLIEETDKIMNAQKARGAMLDTGKLTERVKALVPVLIPLFISAFRRADELAMAMECRCYRGGEGRTRLKVLRCCRQDYIDLAFCIVCFGVILASRLVFPNY